MSKFGFIVVGLMASGLGLAIGLDAGFWRGVAATLGSAGVLLLFYRLGIAYLFGE